MPPARISLTLFRHFSLSFIASSVLHPVSSHSCCMYVRAGRPAFAWPYAGFHRSTSLMNSSLLLLQCPACLVRLTCIVFVMWGRWSYSWCLVGCSRQEHHNVLYIYIYIYIGEYFNHYANIYIYIYRERYIVHCGVLYIYIYIKLASVVEGDLKTPFSIATTPRCRWGRYSFLLIALLYPWSLHYNAEW